MRIAKSHKTLKGVTILNMIILLLSQFFNYPLINAFRIILLYEYLFLDLRIKFYDSLLHKKCSHSNKNSIYHIL